MVNPETRIVAKTQKDAGAAITYLMKRLYGRKRRLYGCITQTPRQQELFDGTTAKLTLLPEFETKAITHTLSFYSLIHSSFDDLSVLLKKSLFQTCVYPDKICYDHSLSIGISLDIQKRLLITSSRFV